MNHTYRVVYNEATNTYTAVAENVPARGKSSKSKKALAAVVAAAALQLTAVSAEAAVAMSKTDTVQAQLNPNEKRELLNPDGTKKADYYTGATATGNNIAIGEHANVTSPQNSIAIGANTTVAGGVGAGEGAVAIGHQAYIAGENGSVAIGENSSVGLYLRSVTHRWYQNPYNGHANQTKLPADPTNESQIVSNGNLVETVSVAVGRNSVAQGSSTAIGANAVAKVGTGRSGALDRRALSVAIGSNTLATSGGVSIGGSLVVRQHLWVMAHLHMVFLLLQWVIIQLHLVNLQLHLVMVLLRLVVRMHLNVINQKIILWLMAPMRLRLVQKPVQVQIMQLLLLIHR